MMADGRTGTKSDKSNGNGYQQFAFFQIRRRGQGGGSFTPELYSSHGAGGQAVHATYTTCVVDAAVFDVDASSVAGFDTTAAFDAFFRDREFEQADSGYDAKHCADRADGIAEEAFAPKCQGDDDENRQEGPESVGGENTTKIGIRIQ